MIFILDEKDFRLKLFWHILEKRIGIATINLNE